MDKVKSQGGKIRITWRHGHKPDDFDTFAWQVGCEPLVRDELVTGMLAEVLKAY